MPERLDFRIFLSSPGDVNQERGLARGVIDRLGKEGRFRDSVHLDEISWDDPDAALPIRANLTPQFAIERGMAKPSECDIVVVILWSRMGTPLPSEYRKPDGSTYMSGTEYEFCEAIGASTSQGGKPIVLVYRCLRDPQVNLSDPDYEEKGKQFLAVRRFFDSFQNPDGSIRYSFKPYELPSDFEDLLERDLRELIQKGLDEWQVAQESTPSAEQDQGAVIKPHTPSQDRPLTNPFRGLRPFREAHAPVFFGRGRETDDLVRRFANLSTRLVAVIGASGSGKSSLVGAGLIPRLRAGAFPGSSDWLVVRFTPAERGSDPFFSLARALCIEAGRPGESPEDLAKRLSNDPSAINTWTTQALTSREPSASLLLFVDQFEELFTTRVSENHKIPFITLIGVAASASSRIRTVLTVRSDYYEQMTRSDVLTRLLRDNGSFPLSFPGTRALTEIIERPLRYIGLTPDEGLADTILKEAGTEPGALALVEFALQELFERGKGQNINVDAYRGIGGIGGVIENQAERAVNEAGSFPDLALDKLFSKLAVINEKGAAVKKSAPLDSFETIERTLVDRLVDSRLLVTSKDETDDAVVEVAHEAVLRHWRRFAKWLEDNRAFLLWRKRLKAWIETDTPLPGGELTEARNWRRRQGANALDKEEIEFLTKSQHHFLRKRIGVGSLAALLGLVLWGQYWLNKENLSLDVAMLTLLAHMGYTPEPELVLIKPGVFQMGDASDPQTQQNICDSRKDSVSHAKVSIPQHTVSLSKPFSIGKYEITLAEYDIFIRSASGTFKCNDGHKPTLPNDEGWGRDNRPAIYVSWEDATCYAEWLTHIRSAQPPYRLPTEAEWEFAARAGTSTQFYWGDDVGINNANCDGCQSQWDARMTAPVGQFKANALGLFDMAGNVWEWVQDAWHDNYCSAPNDGSAWIIGADPTESKRVIRDGSWYNSPELMRTTNRKSGSTAWRDKTLGFRIAQDGKDHSK